MSEEVNDGMTEICVAIQSFYHSIIHSLITPVGIPAISKYSCAGSSAAH